MPITTIAELVDAIRQVRPLLVVEQGELESVERGDKLPAVRITAPQGTPKKRGYISGTMFGIDGEVVLIVVEEVGRSRVESRHIIPPHRGQATYDDVLAMALLAWPAGAA